MDCYFNTGYVYGTSSNDSKYSGIIGVGETWGYAMGYYMLNKKYGTAQDPKDKWFKPKETKALFDYSKITPLRFLSCLNTSVNNLNVLNTELSLKFNKVPQNLY